MSLDIWLSVIPPEPAAAVVYDDNFTHNATPMWRAAGIYDALYMSDGKTAAEVLGVLESGLADMQANPDKYIAMDSPSGWGTYKDALPWLAVLVTNFRANPTGIIGVSK